MEVFDRKTGLPLTPEPFHYGLIGYVRETLKGRKVKFLGFREGIMAGIFEDWR